MRDGRRQRLGIGGTTTATLNAGEDPGNISTSGIGSLINMGDLYTNSVADQNATTGNQAYLDRILSEAGPDTLSLDPGAYVNTRDNRYINDAYNYYLGGGLDDVTEGVDLETGQQDFTGGEMIDTSGEGQATSGLGLGDTTPANTDFEQGLLDQGVGVQGAIGDPVVAPGEIPVTQQVMDEYNAPAILDSESTADEISQDLSNQQAMLNPTGGNIMDEVALTGGFSEFDDLEADPGAYGTINELTDDPTMQETISNAFTSARQGIGDLAEAGVDQIQEVGQSIANTIGGVYNGVDQTISVFGKEINVPTTLAGIALNQVVGAPISLAFGALRAIGGMLPEQDPADTLNRNIVDELKSENDYGYNMSSGTLNQDPFGRNPVSAFGDYEQTLLDDLEYVGDSKFKNAKKEFAQDYYNKKANKTAPQEDIGATDSIANEQPIGDQGSSVNTNTGDITDSTGNYAGNIMDEFGPAPAPAPAPAPTPAPSYGPYSGGGGGGGGGGGSPGSQGPGGSDAMGSFKKGGLAGLKRYAK